MLYNWPAVAGYLEKLQSKILADLFDKVDDFYLAGGTALARYYFQHRVSEDLDFFTQNYARRRIQEIIEYLTKINKRKISLVAEQTKRTAKVRMAIYYLPQKTAGLKIDFVEDYLKLLEPLRKIDGIPVLSLTDIYLRKLYALIGTIETTDLIGRKVSVGRQEAKDFYDLYFLSHTYKRLAEFAWKHCTPVQQEALINWYRTYDRMNIKSGILDLRVAAKSRVDFREIEEHFNKEIDRLLEKEIGKI